MEIETGLKIAADAVEPIAQAVFLSSLHRPSRIERPAIQQGWEFDVHKEKRESSGSHKRGQPRLIHLAHRAPPERLSSPATLVRFLLARPDRRSDRTAARRRRSRWPS